MVAKVTKTRSSRMVRRSSADAVTTSSEKKPLKPTPKKVLEIAMRTLDDDKAQDVSVIKLAGKTTLADFMVIASGTSTRQVGAMADHLYDAIKKSGIKGISIEGNEHCDWVLLDAGDVIVHLFRPEVRAFYDLDKLWVDVPVQGIS